MRTLYLTAYDVADPCRLHRVYHYLSAYRVGGQKSVPEVWVTPAELRQIRAELSGMMDAAEDRLYIFALDPRMQAKVWGRGKTFNRTFFCIV
jgi:CRISPR-associated protein Cas2